MGSLTVSDPELEACMRTYLQALILLLGYPKPHKVQRIHLDRYRNDELSRIAVGDPSSTQDTHRRHNLVQR
jgi:hypothetical protein